MSIGIDSTFLIDILNQEYKPSEEIMEEVVICSQVYFECLLGRNKQKEIEYLVSHLPQLPCSFPIAKRAAEIFTNLKKQGTEIGQADCLIAATYLENGVTKILTRNKKHFEQIEGLEVVEY